jgi:hypothetical protein
MIFDFFLKRDHWCLCAPNLHPSDPYSPATGASTSEKKILKQLERKRVPAGM